MRTPTPVKLHGWPPSSRSEPATCETDSTTSAFVPQPTDGDDGRDCASLPLFPLHVAGRVECSCVPSWPVAPVDPRSLCPHRDVEPERPFPEIASQQSYPTSAPGVSHRGSGHRSRLTTAGFHARRRARFACSHFFPRSVGFGPTASCANGAFTIAPSMLCHAHAIPSISSYSASPFRHSLTKTPASFHSRKYLWIELALPNTDFGNAFHWQPVRNTYTMAANTFRRTIGLRPAPGRRRYVRPFSRFRFGISGATLFHNSSETVQDFTALMHSIISQRQTNSKHYLRISS